jgi:hypothetical protein
MARDMEPVSARSILLTHRNGAEHGLGIRVSFFQGNSSEDAAVPSVIQLRGPVC